MNDIWETIRSFFNYPIIDWWSSPVEAQDAISATETTEAVEAIEAVPSELIFQFSIINIILIFVISCTTDLNSLSVHFKRAYNLIK